MRRGQRRTTVCAAALVLALAPAGAALAGDLRGTIVSINAANESFLLQTPEGDKHRIGGDVVYEVRPFADPPPDPVRFDQLEKGDEVVVELAEGERMQHEATEVELQDEEPGRVVEDPFPGETPPQDLE